jgi:hypothetical protein
MSFSADITTQVGRLRYLIGDLTSASASFSDEDLQGFLSLTALTSVDGMTQSLLLAAAFACDSMAAQAARVMEDIKLGDYQNSDNEKVTHLKSMADRFRDLEYNTPAFAVAEENLSAFNELDIIRNFILRTEA